VKYQDQPEGKSFSRNALNSWLLVTIPLTAGTLASLWFGFKWAERKLKRRDWLPTYTGRFIGNNS